MTTFMASLFDTITQNMVLAGVVSKKSKDFAETVNEYNRDYELNMDPAALLLPMYMTSHLWSPPIERNNVSEESLAQTRHRRINLLKIESVRILGYAAMTGLVMYM